MTKLLLISTKNVTSITFLQQIFILEEEFQLIVMVLKPRLFNEPGKGEVQNFEIGPKFNRDQTVMCHLSF